MRAAVLSVLLLSPLAARAETLAIGAAQDATLVEHPDGALANGAGSSLFAGRSNQASGSVRRALLRFEVPAAPRTPSGPVVVERVALVLTVLPGNDGPRDLRVHRVLAAWSEGPASSGGGGGAPSRPGDVTWVHAAYPSLFWAHNGGVFDGGPLASVRLDGPGTYRLESPELTRAVAQMAARPGANFGLLLVGDETARQTARSIASREHPDPALRPVLEITLREAD